MSGADTHTRKLLMSKSRLEAEFHAELPQILRRAVQSDSSMLPDPGKTRHVLTAMQKNVLSAVYMAKQPHFSLSEEYKSRLDAELQRHFFSCLVCFVNALTMPDPPG